MSADVQAKIAELEAEMARTQKNKATNYHLVRTFCGRSSWLLADNVLTLYAYVTGYSQGQDCQAKK